MSNEGAPLEFVIFSKKKHRRFEEILAMVTYYHANPQHRLGLGHTLPIGEPWVKNSICDHILVSHPYILGPEFEIWKTQKGHGHIFWLLPITKAERDFKIQNGLEELEKNFEDSKLKYWDPHRKSVV